MAEAGTPETVGMSAARLERVGPAMQRYVDSGTYAGVSTLIARRGVVVHEGQYGYRDKEAKAPMTADTIFRLYSMTKPVVSTALMMLLEEGRFRLIDPVAKYIPALARLKVRAPDGSLVDAARPIQVRELLTHTSGLSYSFLEEGRIYVDGKIGRAEVSLEEAIDDLARYPLAFQPGTHWHYSIGIDVAARVLEVVAGQKLGAFLQERLFDPLGMKDTGFGVAPEKRSRVGAMYGRPDLLSPETTFRQSIVAWSKGDNPRINVDETYPVGRPETFQRGGHGLFGTVRDYFRFAQMLANGGELDGRRIIGRKTLELMHANHLPPSLLPIEIGGLPLAGYGFGLGSRVCLDPAQTGAPNSVGEFGWSGAAKTHFWVDPVEQVVGVFMTQSMSSFDVPELDLRAVAYQALVD